MKKTLIALSVTALLSTTAFAAVENHGIVGGGSKAEIESVMAENGYQVVERKGGTFLIKDGKHISTLENGQFYFESKDGSEKTRLLLDKNGDIEVRTATRSNDGKTKIDVGTVVVQEDNWNPNNGAISGGDSFKEINVHSKEAQAMAESLIAHNKLELKGDSIVGIQNGKPVKFGEKLEDGSYTLTDPSTGESVRVEVDENGNATHINFSDGQGANINAKIVDNDMKPMPNPIDPTDQDRADTRNDIADNQKAIADGRAWAAQAEQRFNQEVKRLDSKIDKVEGRVSNGVAMVGAMSQMQFGQGGFGIGAGAANFNGSNAIAIGAGYNFGQKEEWIIKGSFGYAETNKGNAGKIKDTMVAGGVTYTFK
ncbi:hypothetical protein VME0621_00319 [Vibrio mediterranei]|uniref:YadA-like family protein n=1 Tax=Vibrio mediterranei TaxID=689 RepID=UPI0007850D92|nr:YadA-like family protein [Vibrio mediterranei]SBO08227.1 hypothetical protein VME0621_00319 [Vibrio mediterranei]